MTAARRRARGAVPRGRRGERLRARLRAALRLLAAAAAAGGAGAAAYAGIAWLRDPATLPVRHVRIEGELRHVDRARLEAAAAPHARGGILSVDVRALARAVAAVPWVAEVSVRRVWPDTLLVRVREHRPLAAWAGGGAVNTRGERFDAPAGTLPAGLPVLAGPPGSEAELAAALGRWGRLLAPAGLAIRRLELNARRSWRLVLKGGIEVMVGRSAPEARLRRLLAAWPVTLADRAERVARVDLRYTNGFAVRWRPGAAPDRG